MWNAHTKKVIYGRQTFHDEKTDKWSECVLRMGLEILQNHDWFL